MTEQEERELLANVRSFTDHMRMVDEVFKALRIGRNMAPAFQCGHSGLYFRGNYLREWGKTVGIGQGPSPVSEVLDTDYDGNLPALSGEIKRIEQIMYPMGFTNAQVDACLVDVDQVTADGKWAVLATDDPEMEERALIVRSKQLVNERAGALISLETEWNRLRGFRKGLVNA